MSRYVLAALLCALSANAPLAAGAAQTGADVARACRESHKAEIVAIDLCTEMLTMAPPIS